MAAFISVAEWIKIYYSWRPNLKDEGDNHLRLKELAEGLKILDKLDAGA